MLKAPQAYGWQLSTYQSVIQFYVAIYKHKANFVNSVSSWFVFINCIQWTYRSFTWVRNAGSYVCQSHHSNCTVKLLSLQVCWNSRCSWRDGITIRWTYNTGKNPASSKGDYKVKLLKKKTRQSATYEVLNDRKWNRDRMWKTWKRDPGEDYWDVNSYSQVNYYEILQCLVICCADLVECAVQSAPPCFQVPNCIQDYFTLCHLFSWCCYSRFISCHDYGKTL